MRSGIRGHMDVRILDAQRLLAARTTGNAMRMVSIFSLSSGGATIGLKLDRTNIAPNLFRKKSGSNII
jgi:hypothetical protein